MKHFLTKHLALILFHICFIILFLTNFPFGKWFIGWDSINPELNFGVNFLRSFSAFWQENYGLGTLGGHGFAATLPHTIITYVLSFFFSQSAIRPLFTFLCLYLGGLGMYVLTNSLLNKLLHTSQFEKLQGKYQLSCAPFIALFTSLFYMLNFGTVQIFYVQLETFIGHFAALPWLFWIAFEFLQTRSRKKLCLFFIINFFATLQGFIPSLFVAYITALLLFLFTYVAIHKFDINLIRSCLLLLLFTGFINAYWLFPLAYYTFTQNSIFLNSYNNLISTPHFIDVNRKYGDIKNISLIRGYLWDSSELGGFLLQPWINHQQNVIVTSIGYAFFTIIVGGVFASLIWIKERGTKALTGIFFFFFISIGTNLPFITVITNILQSISPTYQQAFRTAFTKFSIGLSFSYSIFLAIGILILTFLLYQKREKMYALILPSIIGIIGLVVFSFPAFQGHLLYKRLLLDLPKPYQEVMSYFKSQPDGRIADFPQECAEGWYAYSWGYFGSGFYWYGVKQPFMSRSFDVWSNRNENYYWEISHAIQTENYDQVDSILKKYDISWALYDPNELYCQNQKDVILQEKLINYLKTSPQYHLERSLSDTHITPILIFKRNSSPSQSFVSFTDKLPNAGPLYIWNDQDTIAETLGAYQTNTNRPYELTYPFRSIFTKRKAEEKEFQIKRDTSTITFSTLLPDTQQSSTMLLPAISTVEKTIPVIIHLNDQSQTQTSLYLTVSTPEVKVGNSIIVPKSKPVLLGQLPAQTEKPILRINGELVSFNSNDIAEGLFSTTQANSILVSNTSGTILFRWNSQTTSNPIPDILTSQSFTLPPLHGQLLSVSFPLTQGNEKLGNTTRLGYDASITPTSCYEPVPSNKNKFEIQGGSSTPFVRLVSQESSQCLTLHFPKLDTDSGYLLEIEARSIQGNHPNFTLYNKEKTAYQDETILTTPTFSTFSYVIPPTFKDEIGYDLQIRNVSESPVISTNDFSRVGIWPIPYTYFKNITLTPDSTTIISGSTANSTTFLVSHPTETYYSIVYPNTKKYQYLLLSQSYNTGWKAYAIPYSCTKQTLGCTFVKIFPFLFGNEIKTHILVNNWENGWELSSNSTNTHDFVIVIFLPQYLQYIGYLILLFSGISFCFLYRKFDSRLKT